MKSNRKDNLTPRQEEVLRFIDEGANNGLPPTFAELRDRLGVSSNQGITELLESLSRKGFLDRRPKRARAILPTAKAKELLRILGKEVMQLSMPLQFSPSTSVPTFSNSIQVIIGDNLNIPPVLSDASSVLHPEKFGSNISATAIEASSWSNFHASSQDLIQQQCLVTVLNIKDGNHLAKSGFTLFQNPAMNVLLWNGVQSGNYFYRGREHGSTNIVSIVENKSGQMTLFPEFDHMGLNSENIIKIFRDKIRRVSNWIDYRIYGGTLLPNFEILFWSRKTAKDAEDTRNLLMACSGVFSNFTCYDQVLNRDIKNCNPFNLNYVTSN